MDTYRECIYRADKACKAAPYYGTCDCEWLIDKDECPEPIAAIAALDSAEECPCIYVEDHHDPEGLCAGCPF